MDVPELVRGLESSPVRSRLLTNALRHSVERTVDEWRAQRGADLHPDSQPPPTPAAPHLVRFLRERLGRNLYVGDHDPSRGGYAAGTGTGGRLTPGGDLLVALGPERPDGGAWTGSDLARVRSHLRGDMIKRLDARVSLAAAFGASIVARVGPGGETARVHIHTLSDVRTDTTVKGGTSSDRPSSSSPNVVELADVLATDERRFPAARARQRGDSSPPRTSPPRRTGGTEADGPRTRSGSRNGWNRTRYRDATMIEDRGKRN